MVLKAYPLKPLLRIDLTRQDVPPGGIPGGNTAPMPRSSRETQPPAPHTIQAMHKHERPRERLQAFGPGALSDAELLAILLRTGYKGVNVIELAGDLLEQCDRLPGLARMPLTELAALK